MNKKIIILVILAFMMCGCASDVTLELSDDGINENISVTFLQDEHVSKDVIPSLFRDYIPVYKDVEFVDEQPDEKKAGIDYYNKTFEDIGGGYIYRYNYKYSLSNYNKSRAASLAFKSFSVIKSKEDNTITVSTDNSGPNVFNIYPDLESFRVNIKPTNEVVEANVEPVNGVYTWTFTNNNFKKNIYLVMKTSDTTNSSNDDNSGNSNGSNITNNDNKDDKKNQDFFTRYGVLIGIGGILLFIVLVMVINNISRRKYE